MKKMLSVILTVSTLAIAVPVSARADTVQVGYTAELLEATTAAEKTADTRDPNSKLSDGVKKAISEGKENISVYLIFKYNAEEIGNEAEKRAEKEISELDQSEYNEKVIYAIKSKYLKEVNNEYINSILNEIGTDISQTQNKGWLTCTLDQEQINAAEANEKILGIFLDAPNYYLPLSDPLIYKETSESDIPTSVSSEDVQKFYTYNELIQMSDEEFSELYDYSAYYFGNDEVPDEIKFEKYLNQVPDFYIGDNYEGLKFGAYKRFKSGECVPYLTLGVDRYTPLSEELTTDMLGYPDKWDISLHDGVWYPEIDIPVQLHEYRIEVPVEIVADFETFVRLEKSYKSIDNYDFLQRNSWGIECFHDIYQQFCSYGDNVSNLYGDANLDYKVNIADAVLVIQVATNPDKYAQGKSEYSISAQGEINADVDGKAGLTNEDALLIQKLSLS